MDLPADPTWLHVARTTAVLGAASIAGATVDFADDVTLAIGESALEICVTPGVETLEIRVELEGDRVRIRMIGHGGEIEYEDDSGTIVDAVLAGLASDSTTERSGTEYSIAFSVSMSP